MVPSSDRPVKHPKNAAPIIPLIASGSECAMMTASTGGCLFNNYLAFCLVLSLGGSIEPRVSIGNNKCPFLLPACEYSSLHKFTHPPVDRFIRSFSPPSVPCSPNLVCLAGFPPRPPTLSVLKPWPSSGIPFLHSILYKRKIPADLYFYTTHSLLSYVVLQICYSSILLYPPLALLPHQTSLTTNQAWIRK